VKNPNRQGNKQWREREGKKATARNLGQEEGIIKDQKRRRGGSGEISDEGEKEFWKIISEEPRRGNRNEKVRKLHSEDKNEKTASEKGRSKVILRRKKQKGVKFGKGQG